MEPIDGKRLVELAALALCVASSAAAQGSARSQVCDFAHAAPRDVGVDAAAVDSLVAAAKGAHSDALVIVKDGRVIREWYADSGRAPMDLYSGTKSIVGMLIVRLIEQGRIKSLDQPVAVFYPEWRQGQKRLITIRQLLNHTSGLQNVAWAGTEVDVAPDVVRLALAAELSSAPGTAASYNNKAIALLSGVIERAAGMPMDRYAMRELFAPLCIARPHWLRDDAGRPYGHTGLWLDALSSAKIGEVMLDTGTWHGRAVLSRGWVDSLVAQSSVFSARTGLLWWRLPQWTAYRLDSALLAGWLQDSAGRAFAAKLRPMMGRSFSEPEFNAALDDIFGAGRGRSAWDQQVIAHGLGGRRAVSGPLVAAYADGYLGQYIVVIPATHIVAARKVRPRDSHTSGDDWLEFPDVVVHLLGPPAAGTTPKPH